MKKRLLAIMFKILVSLITVFTAYCCGIGATAIIKFGFPVNYHNVTTPAFIFATYDRNGFDWPYKGKDGSISYNTLSLRVKSIDVDGETAPDFKNWRVVPMIVDCPKCGE